MMKTIKSTRKAGSLILLGLLAIFLTGFTALRPLNLSRPSAGYSVGTVQLEMTYPTPKVGGNQRKLLVQLYYPSQKHSERISYTPNPKELEEELSSLYGIPKFLIKKLSRSKVPVQQEAAPLITEKKFPVLIFSHGMNGTRFQNSFLIPQLVSKGYIVASIEHTGAASGTVFQFGERGSIIPFEKLMSDEEFSTREVNKWSEDQRNVLDQLKKMVTDKELHFLSSADFDSVGVFGHSFGGATAAVTLTKDKRFKAGINMDGFYFGEAYKKGFTQPFMQIRADNKPAHEMKEKELKEFSMTREKYQEFMFDKWNKRIESYAKNGYESVVVRHSNHMSFSDFTLIMPLSFITAPHREEHHEITTSLVLSFFDQHLKNKQGQQLPEELQAYIK